MPYFPTRKTTIFAQDPSIRLSGKIVRAQIDIPNEELQPGPRGYRVQVVDYDSSTHTLYKTVPRPSNRDGRSARRPVLGDERRRARLPAPISTP